MKRVGMYPTHGKSMRSGDVSFRVSPITRLTGKHGKGEVSMLERGVERWGTKPDRHNYISKGNNVALNKSETTIRKLQRKSGFKPGAERVLQKKIFNKALRTKN